MGIRVFFQLDPEFLDQGDKVGWGFMGGGKRSPGMVLKPVLIAGLEAVEPFEEPKFGSPSFAINGDGFFSLKVLFDRHFSQSFFVHRSLSWDDLFRDAIRDFNPRVNDVVALVI